MYFKIEPAKSEGALLGFKNLVEVSMGGIQRAGTGKNEKVTEIFPLLVFWPEGLGIKFL
jgi:hypothetical protein